jgi:hypothetical protein
MVMQREVNFWLKRNNFWQPFSSSLYGVTETPELGVVIKVLLFLADMLRADLFEPERPTNPLEEYILGKGALVFTNAFTGAPDSPRGTASIFSGLPPSAHGVDLRTTQISQSFTSGRPSIFQSLRERGVSVAALVAPSLAALNVHFPPETGKFAEVFVSENQLKEWLLSRREDEDVFVYRHENVYHEVVDQSRFFRDLNYWGARGVHKSLRACAELAEFDTVWLTSDHGCIFPSEKRGGPHDVDDNRTRVVLCRSSVQDQPGQIHHDSRLVSNADLYTTLHTSFGLQIESSTHPEVDLNSSAAERPFIAIEDYAFGFVADGQLPNVFSIVTKNSRLAISSQGAWTRDPKASNWESISAIPHSELQTIAANTVWFSKISEIWAAKESFSTGYGILNADRDPLLSKAAKALNKWAPSFAQRATHAVSALRHAIRLWVFLTTKNYNDR